MSARQHVRDAYRFSVPPRQAPCISAETPARGRGELQSSKQTATPAARAGHTMSSCLAELMLVSALLVCLLCLAQHCRIVSSCPCPCVSSMHYSIYTRMLASGVASITFIQQYGHTHVRLALHLNARQYMESIQSGELASRPRQKLLCKELQTLYINFSVTSAGPWQMPSCTHVASGSWTYCTQPRSLSALQDALIHHNVHFYFNTFAVPARQR